jgi:hypothetical protein
MAFVGQVQRSVATDHPGAADNKYFHGFVLPFPCG